MTLTFKELAGSPVESYEPGGMKAQRRLLCTFEDRHAVVAALLGGAAIGGPSGAMYPDRPGIAATRVRVEPFEKRPDNQGAFDDLTADLNSYSGQFVEITVDYEVEGADGRHPNLPRPEDGTLLSYRMDFGGEYMTLPGQTLRWQSESTAPVPPDAVPTVRLPIIEHHITWQRVALPPWRAIRTSVGAVNATAFMGAEAETVLFDGAKADREFHGLDDLQRPQFGWRLTYVFREKAIKVLAAGDGEAVYGWNHAYRPAAGAAGQWDRLVDAEGNPLYRAVDLAALFASAAG